MRELIITCGVLTIALLQWPGVSLAQATNPSLKIEGRKHHPTVYYDRADLARARANRAKYDWAKTAAEKLLKVADEWAAKDDAKLRSYIPEPGACFAYGFSGCPKCGAKTGASWGQGGSCTLDDPKHIKCDNGHRLPDEQFPDDGTGYKDPKTGKMFYLVGSYNAYVIDTLNEALNKLTLAWSLTGDRKYGDKAALILDELARIYPECDKGSWDYPSTPPSGRFNRPWYQVARTLILYTNHYDLLMNDSAGENILDTPSSVSGMTKRENIEQHLLLNGAKYCYDQSLQGKALHNGQADYVRGCMVVGVAMGIPYYVNWGVNSPLGFRNMIENNIDRDGQYYETSSLYAHHSRYLYQNIAEVLQNYRDDDAFKEGIHFAQDLKFRALFMLPNARTQVTGLKPMLGDDGPNAAYVANGFNTMLAGDLSDLEHLVAMTRDPQLEQLLLRASGGTPASLAAARAAARDDEWLLFRAGDISATAAIAPAGSSTQPAPSEITHPLTNVALNQTDLLAQKGLATLRADRTGKPVALTLRFGPTLNHGHYDELQLGVYDAGNDLSYDLGYGLGSTHTQVGWSKQTTSHNTVVVDETSQLKADGAGGIVERFITLPWLSLISADDPNCYTEQKVERYSRTVGLIGDGEYALDIFRIRGGKQHDYLFHGRGTTLDIAGLSLGDKQPGSVAGQDITWAEHLGVDGDIDSMPNKPYWVAPPGNGYGFMRHPRSAEMSRAFTATWTIDGNKDQARSMRLTSLPIPGTTLTVFDAPGIYPSLPKASYIMLRRSSPDGGPLESTYVNVIEPVRDGGSPEVASIDPLIALEASTDAPVAVKVTLADGRIDYWFDGAAGRDVEINGNPARIDAGLVVIRCDKNGTVVRELHSDGFTAKKAATIDRIDDEKGILHTSAKIDGATIEHTPWVRIASATGARPSLYRVASTEPVSDGTNIRLAPTSLLLGRGHLDDAPKDKVTLANVVPLSYAHSVTAHETGFFVGKKITTPDGRATATIRSVVAEGTTIQVDSASMFKAGDDLLIRDVSIGDALEFAPLAAK